MAKENIQDFVEDFALLIEAGFVAVKQLDELSSTRIFEAAQILKRDSTAPKIGLGYIALNKLDIKEATRIFSEVVNKEKDNQLARTFLGMCYLLSKGKHQEGQVLIKDAINKTADPTIENLGTIALEWWEKDLQKQKAPFFGTEKQK